MKLTSIKFSMFSVLFSLLFIHLESFIFMCSKNNIQNIQNITNQILKNVVTSIISQKYYIILFINLILYLVTIKLNDFIFMKQNLITIFLLIIFIIIIILKVINIYNETNSNIYILSLLTGGLFIFFLNIISSLLTFLFLMEIFSVLYYFFFLEKLTKNSDLNLINFKNNLLIYLWNCFLTTIIYGISLFFLLKENGTVDLFELYIIKQSKDLSLLIFFISFFIKLGLPGFHFLKLEIYKYLPIKVLIIFSTITLLLNINLLTWVIFQDIFFSFIISNKVFTIIILFVGFFSLIQLTLDSWQQFIAFSSLLTMFTIISLLII